MSIWLYDERASAEREIAYVDTCIYCQTLLHRDKEDEQKIEIYEAINYGMSDTFQTIARAVIGVCPACG